MMSHLKSMLAGGLLALFAGAAFAQAPVVGSSDPMRFIVPFPPGGTLDVLARTVANELGPALGRTIVVENKSGASGALGAQFVARAPADGNTVFIASNTLVTLPALRNNLPFDVFKDFSPIVMLGETPTVITVHPSFPARNFKEFIAAVKAANGGVNYNSPGLASPPHLTGELLARATGITLNHVPYRGTQPAVADLLAGQVPVMMAPLNAVLPYIQDKLLFPIAVTDATRTKYLPDVPTVQELGVNMPAVTSWFAILTTGGTPPEVITKLNAAITKIVKDSKIENVLSAQTFEIKSSTAESLAKIMREDAATNAKIVSEAKITAE